MNKGGGTTGVEKIISWIEEHKKRSILLMVAIICLPIVAIHILFKIKTGYYLIQAEWEPGEVLGYFGDVLSFLGTVILGYIAITQTERANTLSKDLLELEWKTRQPCLYVDGNECYKLYIGSEEVRCCSESAENDSLKVRAYYIDKNNRTGVTMPLAVMAFNIKNTGGSDICKIAVKSQYCYLSPILPEVYNACMIGGIEGNTCISQGQTKKLYIEFAQEVDPDEENFDYDKAADWVLKNETMTPAFSFELFLTTVDGIEYKEYLECGTDILKIKYKEHKIKKVKRALHVRNIKIERVRDTEV